MRERKKVRTRHTIRAAAFRLFRENGYAETTVEQIAAAAEVSPSTFFRYFPSKEQLILAKELPEKLMDVIRRQPAGLPPLTAYRKAGEEIYAAFDGPELDLEKERRRIVLENPELRKMVAAHVFENVDRVANALAHRAKRDPADFEIRVLAGALIGAILGVMDQTAGDLSATLRAITVLEDGLAVGREVPHG